jgi:hypothetical protein
MLDSLLSANAVCDNLIDAEQPWEGEKPSESPECEPLQKRNDVCGEILRYLLWKWQGDDHDWEKDEPRTTLARAAMNQTNRLTAL